ncbi:MAG: BamA/TamA family outer membrane protein [Pirellulaceae bacterium]
MFCALFTAICSPSFDSRPLQAQTDLSTGRPLSSVPSVRFPQSPAPTVQNPVYGNPPSGFGNPNLGIGNPSLGVAPQLPIQQSPQAMGAPQNPAFPSNQLSTPAQVPLGNAPLPSPNAPPIGIYPGPGSVAPNAGVYPPRATYPTAGAYQPGTYQPGTYPPGAYAPNLAPGATTLQPGDFGGGNLPYIAPGAMGSPNPQPSAPNERFTPIDVFLSEGRTGRFIFGGTVNSDLGVAGKFIFEEHNFDFRQLTPNANFLQSGGQHLRIELMPGNEVQRYTGSWTQPNLLGYLPYSLSVGGFYYTRGLRDWSEQRGGGRVALGYKDNRSFSISSELRMEDVKVFRPRVGGVAELDSVLGSSDIYRVRFRVARDTRDSPFISGEGGLLELVYDQVFGEFDYPRGQINWSRFWTIGDSFDPRIGRRTLSHSWRVGITGSQTPIFENFYAGGFSTLRGFDFRGASPRVGEVEVGGELSLLGSLEYSVPITADDMFRGVAFVDYGTVEQELEVNSDNLRVSLGLGVRVAVPFLSPAPFAFDFAYPVLMADTDERNLFSFFVGATR